MRIRAYTRADLANSGGLHRLMAFLAYPHEGLGADFFLMTVRWHLKDFRFLVHSNLPDYTSLHSSVP